MQALINTITHIFLVLLERMTKMPRPVKQGLVFFVDLILLQQSIWISYSLRLGQWVFWDRPIALLTAGALALMIPIFFATGVYNMIFRYAGIGMFGTLIRAFIAYGFGMSAIYMFGGFTGVPRTIGIIQPFVFFLMLLSTRVVMRSLIVDFLGRGRFGGDIKRVLIYGAGKQGQQVAVMLRNEPAMKLCGFIDDDRRLVGQRLDGIIVHDSRYLNTLIESAGVTDLLLALPNISRKRRRTILAKLGECHVNVLTLPPMMELVDGGVSISDIRSIDIEDLLGRESVQPHELLLGRTVVGKNVLVTGAGGSIGSELCRQIQQIGAKKLVLLDMSEFALYGVEEKIQEAAGRSRNPQLEIVAVLGNVDDRANFETVLREHTISTVYHAAAYKHVPLVEANPLPAIRNNVIGTHVAVEAAVAAGVEDFILISTDKAVRPTNVMGATKRAAEQILQSYDEVVKTTRFSIVRFGNVLNSSGSVVPKFRKQIESGGPITITHRDVTRYFMTIPEAASLVIQAGGLAKGGEVFVLDMGKPIRILDLATTMVKLSGLTVRDFENPDGDIEISEIGLRPGEKLYEELLIGEDPQKTPHSRIMMAREEHLPTPKILELVEALRQCRSPAEAIEILQILVPEFAHRRDDHAETILADVKQRV